MTIYTHKDEREREDIQHLFLFISIGRNTMKEGRVVVVVVEGDPLAAHTQREGESTLRFHCIVFCTVYSVRLSLLSL